MKSLRRFQLDLPMSNGAVYRLTEVAAGHWIVTAETAIMRRIIRIKSEDRSLIDHAAQARGKNRTDFVLEAARLAAEEVLLDQAFIAVDPDAYAAFLARLDMPPQPNKRLRKTMQTPAPWDKA
jgi:uncharacterized protein (DUF1778 family)